MRNSLGMVLAQLLSLSLSDLGKTCLSLASPPFEPLSDEGDSPWLYPPCRRSSLLFLSINLTRDEQELCHMGPSDDDVTGALWR